MKLYLDALESCGTDACLTVFIQNVDLGRVARVQEVMFMVSLPRVTVSEHVAGQLYVSTLNFLL